MKSNDRYRLLMGSSLSSISIPFNILSALKKEGLIQETDEIDHYTLTGKGIFKYETESGKITEDEYIGYLDNKLFNLKSDSKKLSEKEKVILFAMMSARSFSANSPIDLKKDDYTLNSWENILNKSYDLLNELKVIVKLKKEGLFGRRGNEHPVSNLIRHTDALPKKTKGIYKAPGKQKYYLDVFKNDKLDKKSIIFILELIFSNKYEEHSKIIEQISNFYNNIAAEKSAYIYDPEIHIFDNPKYDKILYDIIRDVIYLSSN